MCLQMPMPTIAALKLWVGALVAGGVRRVGELVEALQERLRELEAHLSGLA